MDWIQLAKDWCYRRDLMHKTMQPNRIKPKSIKYENVKGKVFPSTGLGGP
jgi:hypothetical protein